MNSKKIIIGVASLFVVLISGYFLFEATYNKPHLNIEASAPEIIIDAAALVNDFGLNEQDANEKYLDKIIQVKGSIGNIKYKNNKAIITLGDGGLMGNVVCHMSISGSQKSKDLTKGQNITIKGKCTGHLLDVILVESTLIK